jgi:hypothetical protein
MRPDEDGTALSLCDARCHDGVVGKGEYPASRGMTASHDHHPTPINQTDEINVGQEGRYEPSKLGCDSLTHPSCHAARRRRGIFFLVHLFDHYWLTEVEWYLLEE